MAKHAMFRSDNMAGTTLGQFLATVRVDADTDNGTLVAIGAYEEGSREIRTTMPVSEGGIDCMAILGSEEVDKERPFNTVGEFTNKAGSLARAYILHPGDTYAVTAEAFAGAAPKVGDGVGSDDNGRHVANNGTTVGVCVAIENEGATMWYVIAVGHM